jgi:hypothetical protein
MEVKRSKNMQQSLSVLSRGVFDHLRVRAKHALTLVPPVAPAVPEALDKAPSNGVFLEAFRANLHAAVRHAALGHAAPSFRECTGAACRGAADMIPELEAIQSTVSDDELEAVLGEVLSALGLEGTPYSAPKPN